MAKSIIIIGGGLTGLAAGCYGQMNGYQTSIFEMGEKAGASAPPGNATVVQLTAR